MKKTTLSLLLLFASLVAFAQNTSWGDGQSSGTRESASTAAIHSSRFAVDDDKISFWGLDAGSTSGWMETFWAAPRGIGSIQLDARLPAGVTAQFYTSEDNHWIPIPGAVVMGPVSSPVSLDLPGGYPAVSRVLVTLEGPSASGAEVSGVTFGPANQPVPYRKILPRSYTFNQSEYVNIKASRLWDGIAGNNWFEPLWSFPWEVFQTDDDNKPTAIFPPYFGNPPRSGEIIWELDGTYQIQTLKANFLQASRNVQVEFWNGTKWTNPQQFGTNWSDGASGWKRIDLSAAVSTNRLRFTFPSGWERARFLGELEVWGTGWRNVPSRSLVVAPAVADGTRLFAIEDMEASGNGVDVLVDGLQTGSLSGDWNGETFQAAPFTWLNQQTVYHIDVPVETFRTGTQFLRIKAADKVRNVVVQAKREPGRVDLGWPYSDGILARTQAGPQGTVPSWKSKKWMLGAEYALEHIRVYSSAPVAPVLKVGLTGKKSVDWTTVTWKSQGTGWWEATLGGIRSDQISLESTTTVVVDEVELSATALVDTRVGMEIWWPRQLVTSQASDTNSVIGWMGDPSVQPRLGGFAPRQSDKLFWLPLSAMGLGPDEDWDLGIEGTLGTMKQQGKFHIRWSKTSPGTFDQGEAFLNTAVSTLTLSGSVKDSKTRVFIDGNEVSVVAGKFSGTKVLVAGHQTAVVELWDKNKKKRQIAWTKEIYQSTGSPLLRLDQPYGDLSTQLTGSTLSGRVGNGLGLTLKINGEPVVLKAGQFAVTKNWGSGVQHWILTLQDGLGRTTTQDLSVERDSTAPVIRIDQPLQAQYVRQSQVALTISAGTDPGLWWKINNEPWEFDPANGHRKSYTLADGFYHFDVTAQDQAGNVSSTAKVDFVVDPTPPKPFALVSDSPGWSTNPTPTLTFATTDATSGLERFEMSLDGGAWQTVVSPLKLAPLSEGPHQVVVRALDKAGNTTIASVDANVDRVAPSAFTSGINVTGWTSNNRPSLTFATTDLTSGVARYEVKIDQGAWIAQTSPYQVPTLSDGPHVLTVRAVDQALNTTTAPAVSVSIDATAPRAFSAGINVSGWTSNNRPIVSFATTDDTSGVQRFEVKIDDAVWAAQTSPFQAPVLADGVHSIAVRAVDAAGNTTSDSVSAFVDTTAPVAVTELRLIPGPDRLDGLWATTDTDIVRFHLIRIEGETATELVSTSASYAEGSLTPGTTLQLKVQPEDRAGNLGPWMTADAAIAGLAAKAVDSQSTDATLVEYENVKIVIAPSALPPEVKAVLINEIESPELVEKSDNPIVGPIYSFSSLQDDGTGQLIETTHTEFPKDLLVTLDYDDSLVPNGFPESNLGVYYYDTLWSKWFRVEKAAIDIEQNKIIFLTNHFTNFSVQPTLLEDLKPQELKDAGHSPFKSESTTGEVSVSPQGGTMMTEATEFVLKGKNGFTYPIKRMYDSQTARVDSPSMNLSMTLGINFGADLAASITSQLITGGINMAENLILGKLTAMFQKNGDYPYALGIGWRLNVPYVRASDTTVIVRMPTGGYYPINQMDLQGEAPVVSGMRSLTFENHRSEDFTFTVHQVRGDVSGILGNLSSEGRQGLNTALMKSLKLIDPDSGSGGGNVSIAMLANLIPGWTTIASELVTKDGTRYAFDGFGRIVTITDPSGTNVIDFVYRGFVLEKIVDPLGNEVTFEYNDGALSGLLLRPSIKKISAPGPEGSTRSVNYEYDTSDVMNTAFMTLPAMTSATDVKGRKTTYGIDKRFLFSGGGSAKINFLATLLDFIPGASVVKNLIGFYSLTISGHINLEWPRLIDRIEAPGLGVTKINYENKDLSTFDARPADFFMGISWLPTALKLSYEFLYRIITDSVEFQNGGLSRSTSYDYQFTTRDSQWLIDRAVINDGLTSVTQHYTLYSRQYNRYVSVDDAVIAALKQGVFTEESNVEKEWYPLATSKVTSFLGGASYENQTTSWDVKNGRPLVETTTRGPDYRRTVEHGYDNWGNEIRLVATAQTPQSTTVLRKDSWYKGTDSSAPVGLPAGLQSTPAQVISGTRNLLLAEKTTTSRPAPEFSSADVSFQGYAYDQYGRPVWQALWNNDHWAASTRSYYPVTDDHNRLSGQLKETLSPTLQKTTYSYDFTTLRSQNLWIETKTFVDVADPRGQKANQTEETAYDWGTNWTRKTRDSQGFVSETRYDALGRPVSIVKPGQEAASPASWSPSRVQAPWDRVVYNDSALTTTIFKETANGTTWNPTAVPASEFYQYDSRGNLVSISKYERSVAPNQTSVTKAAYDAHNRVISMTDPLGRTTSYTFDALSRPLVTTFADNTTQSVDYDDALGRRDSTNERGKVTRELLNWDGKPEVSTVDLNGQAIKTTTKYDAAGRPHVVIDPLNQPTITTYSVFGSPSQVRHPDLVIAESSATVSAVLPVLSSKTVTPLDLVVYDDEGRAVLSKKGYEGVWRTTSTTYDGRGRVLKQDVEGRETWTWNDGSGRPVRQSDPDQTAVLAAYGNGSLEASGAKFTLTTYTSRGQVATQTDPSGAVVTYGYDRDDHKILMRDPRASGANTEKFSIRYVYDDLGRLVTADLPPVTGQSRGSVQFVYDLRGNAVRQTDADGKVTTWTYDQRNRKTSQTVTGSDGKTLVTATGYDEAGNVIKEIVVQSLAATPSESQGLVTTKQYDGVNRVFLVSLPDGQRQNTRYDDLGRVVETWNAQNNTTLLEYNTLGKVTKTIEPENKVTEQTYNVWGEATGTKYLGAASGTQVWVRGYEAHGQLAYEQNNAGQKWTYQYNGRGLVTETVDPRGTTTATGYTDTGLPLNRTLTNAGVQQTQSWTYDLAGALMTSTDGGVTTRVNQAGGTFQADPYDLITSYSTTLNGRTVTLANAYDLGQRPVSTTYPDGTVVAVQYNGLGQLDAINGFASGGQYNFMGRLTNLTAANGTSRTKVWDNSAGTLDSYTWGGTNKPSRFLEWDNRGNLYTQTKNDPSKVNQYYYDELNRLEFSQERDPVEVNAADSASTRFGAKQRDVGGRLGLDYGLSATPFRLDYNASSVGLNLGTVRTINKVRLTGVSERINARTVELYVSSEGADGTWSKLDGLKLVTDQQGTTIQLRDAAEGQFLKLHMTWDERDAENQPLDRSTLSGTPAQLIQVWVTVNGQTTSWTYDSLGNRLTQTRDTTTSTTYYSNTSRIQTNGDWEFNYDASGNLVSRGNQGTWNAGNGQYSWNASTGELWTFTYDLANRLTAVSHSTAGSTGLAEVVSYVYDIRNLRVAQTKKGITTYYQYDTSGDLIWSDDGTNATKYVQALGQVWAEVRTNAGQSKTYYHHTDYEGTTNLVTDASGAVVWDGDYEAFGTLTRSNGTLGFTPSYTGKQFDSDTGLYYYNARWYDATLGRFISEDPARDGENWLIYVEDNPLRWADPTGLLRTGTVPGALATIDRVETGNAAADWVLGVGATALSAPSSAANYVLNWAGGVLSAGAGAYNGLTGRDLPSDLENTGNSLIGTPLMFASPELKAASAGLKAIRGTTLAGDAAKTVQAAKVAGATDSGVDLALTYKPGWTAEQRAAADLKAKALTEASTVVTEVGKRGTAQGLFRQKAGLTASQDADHIVDLQLGGKDVPENLWGLDMSVNRSFGSQIQSLIKDLPVGTKVGKVSVGDKK